MLITPHPALNQLIDIVLGMALAVSDMTNTWREQHLLVLHAVASADAKVVPDTTHAAGACPVRRNDPATHNRDLTLAAQAGSMMAVQSLLAEGASLRTHDADGRAALIAAVMTHMGAAARLLIQAGADVGLRDNMQNSAFLPVASQNDAETVRLTLSYGTNLHATNADGDTAPIPAARRGYVGVVNELVKAGVPPDATNNLGLTALIEAVALGNDSDRHEKAVQVLLNGGTDLNLADHGGVTPMRRARQRGFRGIGTPLFKARGH